MGVAGAAVGVGVLAGTDVGITVGVGRGVFVGAGVGVSVAVGVGVLGTGAGVDAAVGTGTDVLVWAVDTVVLGPSSHANSDIDVNRHNKPVPVMARMVLCTFMTFLMRMRFLITLSYTCQALWSRLYAASTCLLFTGQVRPGPEHALQP